MSSKMSIRLVITCALLLCAGASVTGAPDAWSIRYACINMKKLPDNNIERQEQFSNLLSGKVPYVLPIDSKEILQLFTALWPGYNYSLLEHGSEPCNAEGSCLFGQASAIANPLVEERRIVGNKLFAAAKANPRSAAMVNAVTIWQSDAATPQVFTMSENGGLAYLNQCIEWGGGTHTGIKAGYLYCSHMGTHPFEGTLFLVFSVVPSEQRRSATCTESCE